MEAQQPRREILVRRLTDDQVRTRPGIDAETNFEAHCNAGDKIFFFTNLTNMKSTNNIEKTPEIIIYCKNKRGDYRFAKGEIHYIELTENDEMMKSLEEKGFVFVWGNQKEKYGKWIDKIWVAIEGLHEIPEHDLVDYVCSSKPSVSLSEQVRLDNQGASFFYIQQK